MDAIIQARSDEGAPLVASSAMVSTRPPTGWSTSAGWGAIVVAAMSWGAIGPVLTLLPAGTSSLTVAAARIGVGAVGFLPLVVRRPGRVGDLRHPGVRGWMLAAVAANLIMHLTFIASLTLAGIAIGTMLHVALCPVFTALIERLVTGARLTLRWCVTAVPAVGGCVALVLDSGTTVGPHLVVGVAAGVLSSVGSSVFTVCSSRVIGAGHCSTAVMATVFCGSALALAPVWWLYPMGWIVTPGGAAVVLFLGLVATSGAYCLLGFGLRHTAASTSAVLELAEPATAAVLAFALLGEHLGPLGLAGLTAVLTALTSTAVPGRRPPRARVARRIGPRHAGPAAMWPGLSAALVPGHRSPAATVLGSVGAAEFGAETWRRLEVEAASRGVRPGQLVVELVDLALSARA